jgi:hypothetical protein
MALDVAASISAIANLRLAEGAIVAGKGDRVEISVAEVVDFMRINDDFAPVLRKVYERKITVEAARKSGIRVTSRQLQKEADDFRQMKGLVSARDTERWLKSIGIDLDTLEAYLETNLLIRKFKERLFKKVDQTKFIRKRGVKSHLEEMSYEEWLQSKV